VRRHKSNSQRRFEKLEDRRLMAADIEFSAGTLTIDGTNGNDEVAVRFEGNRVYVDDVGGANDDDDDDDDDDDAPNGWLVSNVSRIVFNGYAGDDTLTVNVAALNAGVTLDNEVLEFHGDADDDSLFNVLSGGVRVEAWGNAGRDILQGSKYNDRFDGGDGENDFHGGRGNDNYVFSADALGANSIFDENGNVDTDTLDFSTFGEGVYVNPARFDGAGTVAAVGSDSDFRLNLFSSLAIENVVGSDYQDYLWGSARPNHISGGGDDDYFFGAGNDTLEGGAGDDTYMFGADNPGTYDIVEAANADSDWLNFGEMPVGLTIDLTKSGTSFAVDSPDLKIRLSNSVAIENVFGTDQSDTIIGNNRNNHLLGFDGADDITGGLGSDTLEGGDSHDTYIFAGTNLGNDYVIEAANEHQDTLDFSDLKQQLTIDLNRVGVRYAVDSTNLRLSLSNDTAIEKVIGTAFNDVIRGNSRDNQIHGRGGNDTLEGRAGNDNYVFAGNNLGTDEIIEDANTGDDQLNFYGMSHGLTIDLTKSGSNYAVDSANLKLKLSNNTAIETVYGTDYGDTIIGNGRDNRLYGRGGGDSIRGNGGADELQGGADDDFLYSDLYDEVYGGSGFDTFDAVYELFWEYNPRPGNYRDWRTF
jgi:Ca2+-binding RTX toxin-like protein